MDCNVAVVGAGMAGLTAATALQKQGVDVMVLDKARGPGGRAATRRAGELRFDHGAQYFTARSAAFAQQVEAWRSAQLVEPWAGRIAAIDNVGEAHRRVSENVTRYVGIPGMNAVPKAMASSLRCRFGAQVVKLKRARGWRISLESGEQLNANHLLLTVPPAQGAGLLGGQSPLGASLESVLMDPCWAVMVALEHPLDPGFDGAFVNDGPLSWLARDNSKPSRPAGHHCWVLHGSAEWSSANLAEEPSKITTELLAAFEALLSRKTPGVHHAVAHRWRYAQAVRPLDAPILRDEDAHLIVAGDWCAGSKIEGAFLSGSAAARAIASSL